LHNFSFEIWPQFCLFNFVRPCDYHFDCVWKDCIFYFAGLNLKMINSVKKVTLFLFLISPSQFLLCNFDLPKIQLQTTNFWTLFVRTSKINILLLWFALAYKIILVAILKANESKANMWFVLKCLFEKKYIYSAWKLLQQTDTFCLFF
jgi:hypothetical protein